MELTIIKRETILQEMVFTYWNCPRCGKELRSSTEPKATDWWVYCSECQETQYEESKVQWGREFREANRHLIGAIITGIFPAMEDFDVAQDGKDARMERMTLSATSSEMPEGTVIEVGYSEYDLMHISYSYPTEPDSNGTLPMPSQPTNS